MVLTQIPHIPGAYLSLTQKIRYFYYTIGYNARVVISALRSVLDTFYVRLVGREYPERLAYLPSLSELSNMYESTTLLYTLDTYSPSDDPTGRRYSVETHTLLQGVDQTDMYTSLEPIRVEFEVVNGTVRISSPYPDVRQVAILPLYHALVQHHGIAHLLAERMTLATQQLDLSACPLVTFVETHLAYTSSANEWITDGSFHLDTSIASFFSAIPVTKRVLFQGDHKPYCPDLYPTC